MEVKSEILTLMKTNCEPQGDAHALSAEKATAISMIFVQREAQRAAQRSINSVLLGVAAQVYAGHIAGGDLHIPPDVAVKEAKGLIAEVERGDG